MTWRSLHIHYHDGQDTLLVECVRLLIMWCRTRDLHGWFFLRHWKHGPHIRLRMNLEEATADDLVAEMQRQIRGHLGRNPSQRTLPASRLLEISEVLAGLEGDPDPATEIVADNTVCSRPYEPEYSKYGGQRGVGDRRAPVRA